jgi:hypothetical protein
MTDFERACDDEGWEESSNGEIVYAGTDTPVDWSKANPLAAMAVLLSGKGPRSVIEQALWKGLSQ